MKGRSISLLNLKQTFAIVILLSCLLLFVGQAVSVMTVWCKDCGDEDNCWEGSGLDSGYDDCKVKYDEQGNPIGCDLGRWLHCTAGSNNY